MSDSEKIGEIEKMIIFKKSTLTGAFLCLLYLCEWHIHINKVGAPSRENFADKSEANQSKLVLLPGYRPQPRTSGRTAPMTEGNRYSRSLYLYKGKKNVIVII